MSEQPANYQDPDPGPMGWDWDNLQTQQKLAIEAANSEQLPTQIALSDAVGASSMPDSVEKAIRQLFKFDSGWSFYVVNELIYGQALTFQQSVGNCVGASHVMGLASRIAHEVLAYGELEEPLGDGNLGMPLCAFSYGVGRDAAGIRGRSDGSTCSGQLKGTHEYGFLPCFIPGVDKYGSLPQGSASANRLFGSSDKEFKKWTSFSQQFSLEESPRISTADEAWDAIVEKHMPIQICSGQGFKFWKDDTKYGPLYKRGGSWSHSMTIQMAFEIGGERFFTVNNQWGTTAHRHNAKVGAAPGSFTISIDELRPWISRAHAEGLGAIGGLTSEVGI